MPDQGFPSLHDLNPHAFSRHSGTQNERFKKMGALLPGTLNLVSDRLAGMQEAIMCILFFQFHLRLAFPSE
jgi:hypothetical protein